MSKSKKIIADIVDAVTGEVKEFLYTEGHPKQYRYNGRDGRFNIDGLTDKGTTFSFQPLAWRIFSDSLFGRAKMESWAEFFFVDEDNCLSSIMFNNSSVTEIMDLVLKLYYARTKLSDVVLTITTDKKTNDKGSWFIAKFQYKKADEKATEQLNALASDAKTRIFRADTVTEGAEYKIASDSYALKTALAGLIQETEATEAEEQKPTLQISSQVSKAA